MTQNPVLEMIDADVGGFRNPRAVVLKEVHWRVHGGEFWIIAGLHRSGKSDLLATAAGIVPPRRGVCRLFGQDIGQQTEGELQSARVRLGVVFDGGRLLHGLTLLENIALPLRYHRNLTGAEAAKQIEPLLELTGLVPWANAYPELMGRNWQQRAGLARALVLRPELLLLDNPLSGLDPQDLVWWTEMLHELAVGHQGLALPPVTIVVTGDSFYSWRGSLHRFAVLKDRGLHVLEGQPETLDQTLLQLGLNATD